MMSLNIDKSQRYGQIVKVKASSVIPAKWYLQYLIPFGLLLMNI